MHLKADSVQDCYFKDFCKVWTCQNILYDHLLPLAMKLDFPRYTERLGAVSIHTMQRIYELASGKSKGFQSSHQTVRKFDYD